jgi:hypothetical protein
MRRLIAAGGVATLLLLYLALPAAAADLTGGCTLEARSFDANGTQLDQGSLPGAAVGPIATVGDQNNPFRVDFDGSVDFVFRTGSTVFQNNHWSIQVQGIPVLSGSDDNPLDVDETGTVTISKVSLVPGPIVGLFHVTGDLYGNNDADHCHGDGWVYLVGNPAGSLPWDVALGALAFGLIGLVATPYSTTWETDPNAGEQLHTGELPMG